MTYRWPLPVRDLDDSDDEVLVRRGDSPMLEDGGGNDFERMMARKRAENKRFRKKKDIDVINENDDAIAKMIADMRIAAKEDRDLNIEGKPGINKMKMFPVRIPKYFFVKIPIKSIVYKYHFFKFGKSQQDALNLQIAESDEQTQININFLFIMINIIILKKVH